MNTVQETRLKNLGLLVRQNTGGFAGLARDADCNETYLRQLWSRQPNSRTGEVRNLGNALARKIEANLKLEAGWMDQDHTPRDPLEDQLISLFRGLNSEGKDKLLHEANFLHNQAHPGRSESNPFPGVSVPGKPKASTGEEA